MGGGTSKRKTQHIADLVDDIDSTNFVASDQRILYSGLVWKLNDGADPNMASEWVPRKMWLTDAGGLFYFSLQLGKPVGRSTAGLHARLLKNKSKIASHFAFQLHSTVASADSTKTIPSTIFATKTHEERELWVTHLSDSGAEKRVDEEDPLGIFIGHNRHPERRRLFPKITPGEKSGSEFGKISSLQNFNAMDRQYSPCSVATCPGDAITRELDSPRSEKSLSVPAERKKRFSETPGVYMPGTGRVSTSLASVGLGVFAEDMAWITTVPLSKSWMSGLYDASDARRSVPPTNESGQACPERVRRNSQAAFSSKDQTVLVLDWDDTLFPSTWVRQDCGFDWRYNLAEQLPIETERTLVENLLAKLFEQLQNFMHLCVNSAQVVIVTLAKNGWIQASAERFMPQFKDLLLELDIPIIYARDVMPPGLLQEQEAASFRSNEQEAHFWMKVKANAIRQVLRDLYLAKNASWKNIISIGDSDFERMALMTVAEEYVTTLRENGELTADGITAEVLSKDGHLRRLRTKTIKLLDNPSVVELIAQLNLMKSWLPHIVKEDTGMSIVLENSENDDQLNEMNTRVTGKHENLTWMGLADMWAFEENEV